MAANTPWSAAAQEVYQTPRAFLSDAFPDQIPLAQPFEITDEVRAEAGRILGHSFGVDSVNYWRDGARTVWILEEIGRYRPITTGLIVSDGAIEQVKVLIFRESHGWEVRHEFFTDQFIGLRLDNEHQLTAHIDGISGATLSVNALRALARLALYFDKTVQAD
jgi:hypothetical protein